ncbi:MAG TPA: iron ABC transporter substrate-binding protein [Limnochordales bacterium]
MLRTRSARSARTAALLASLILAVVFGFHGTAAGQELVVYSGRSEALVAPVFEQFTQATGIRVVVRYGDTAQLAATILEEGQRSPADVFFAQDAGALGALAAAGRLEVLPPHVLEAVDPRLRSPEGVWVGVTGRARVIVYNTDLVSKDELPQSIWDLLDPRWKGRIGWAPTNASFQAFVTALRVLEGEDRAEQWLRGMLANQPRAYPNNRVIVDAVGRGELLLGLVNHYYLYQFLAQAGDSFPARNHHTRGDAGAIVNVAGVGILDSSRNKEAALRLVEFLLSEETQQYFTDENAEYPVLQSGQVRTNPLLVPLDEIDTPNIDLSDLADLEGTLELLQRVGVL